MTLTEYINTNFPTIKAQLAWSDSVSLPAIIAKALEFYGVSTEAEATDTTKAHALADVAVWRQALNDIALDYNFAADQASFSRSQAVAQVRDNLKAAEISAIAYMPAYTVTVETDQTNSDWLA